ncbi:Transposase DDE domain-containing protein [Halogranum amylolyticum]|uniref:Transposase DDE domain-containing protein n=1 Tax=Halogranum amylolyticum TaxID=660520 RepID=A0A1H8UGI1_9EURY|nr:IS5 family transposase [Halogranum amylolyticum]SEP02329.1 Transposase DDE domain-containing protein [Halogranum amylolyticum]
MPTQLARFTDNCVDLSQKAVVGEPQPPLQKGRGGYADWVIVAIHCLREYLDQPYRRLLDILHEMPRITAKLGLAVDELPDFTTVCTRKQDLEMRIWRVLLRLSASLHEFGEVQAIDSTSLAYRSSSHNYAKRVKDTFESVKTTLLVDCTSGAIFDVHCSMNLPHDTQIAWQVLMRNLDQLETVVADKGSDWDDLRHKLREEGVRPMIKHREFYSLDAAHNARIDDDVYHRRSIVEAIFFSLRKRFGSTTRAKTWFGQFREIVLKAAVRNHERAVRL